MSERIYSLPVLLEMLRESCGIANCGHCAIERAAADVIERLQASASNTRATADQAAHDLANLATESLDAREAAAMVPSLEAEIERLRAENADLLFAFRVQLGLATPLTDLEKAAVARAYEKVGEQ